MRQFHAVHVTIFNSVLIGTDVVLNAVAQTLDVLAGFFNHGLDTCHEACHRVSAAQVFAIQAGRGSTKESCHFIELLLGPLRKRMVVALSTCDVGAKENSQRIGQVIQRHARASPALRGPILLSRGSYAFRHNPCIHEIRIPRGALSREPIFQGR